MPIQTQCTCGRNLRLFDTLAGKQIRCPECKAIILVPGHNANESMNDRRAAPSNQPKSRPTSTPHRTDRQAKKPSTVSASSKEEWYSGVETQFPLPPRHPRLVVKNKSRAKGGHPTQAILAVLCGFVAVIGTATLVWFFVIRPITVDSIVQPERAASAVQQSTNQSTAISKLTERSSRPSTNVPQKTVTVGACKIDVAATIEMTDREHVSTRSMEMDAAQFNYAMGSAFFEFEVFVVIIKPSAPGEVDPLTNARTAKETFEALVSPPHRYLEPQTTHVIGGESFTRLVVTQQRNGRTRRMVNYICRQGMVVHQLQYVTYVEDRVDISNDVAPIEAAIRTFRTD